MDMFRGKPRADLVLVRGAMVPRALPPPRWIGHRLLQQYRQAPILVGRKRFARRDICAAIRGCAERFGKGEAPTPEPPCILMPRPCNLQGSKKL
jgi:hypothetical protein